MGMSDHQVNLSYRQGKLVQAQLVSYPEPGTTYHEPARTTPGLLHEGAPGGRIWACSRLRASMFLRCQ